MKSVGFVSINPHQNMSVMLWLYKNDFILKNILLVITNTTDTYDKNDQYHRTCEELSLLWLSVKLAPADCNNNKTIQGINDLQKVTLDAL